MINFRNCTFGGIVILAALLLLRHPLGLSWYAFLPVIVIYLGLLVYGSIDVTSNFYLPVICRGETTERQIAISFDDGPVPEATAELLDILQREKVPAVFFCIGKHIAGRESIVNRILAEGHLIGNHSYSHHFFFDLYPASTMKADVLQGEEIIFRVTGHRTRLFRPPYGVTTPTMRKVLQSAGYKAIGWTVRSMDTVTRDEEQLLEKIMKGLRPGAVILLHDAGPCTRAVLPALIAAAREKGYEFVRPDRLLNVTAYA